MTANSEDPIAKFIILTSNLLDQEKICVVE